MVIDYLPYKNSGPFGQSHQNVSSRVGHVFIWLMQKHSVASMGCSATPNMWGSSSSSNKIMHIICVHYLKGRIKMFCLNCMSWWLNVTRRRGHMFFFSYATTHWIRHHISCFSFGRYPLLSRWVYLHDNTHKLYPGILLRYMQACNYRCLKSIVSFHRPLQQQQQAKAAASPQSQLCSKHKKVHAILGVMARKTIEQLAPSRVKSSKTV